jgi:hypothetical protein
MLCETVEASEVASQELRWKIVKAMLDEFPELKQRAKAYLKKNRQ